MANPYILFCAFERTAFAELLAAAWIPLLLLAVLRERPTIRCIAIPVALLWLTNAPAAVMGCYMLALLAILRLIASLRASRQAVEPEALQPSRLLRTLIAGTALGLGAGWRFTSSCLRPTNAATQIRNGDHLEHALSRIASSAPHRRQRAQCGTAYSQSASCSSSAAYSECCGYPLFSKPPQRRANISCPNSRYRIPAGPHLHTALATPAGPRIPAVSLASTHPSFGGARLRHRAAAATRRKPPQPPADSFAPVMRTWIPAHSASPLLSASPAMTRRRFPAATGVSLQHAITA